MNGMKTRRAAGFTLMELLMTIMIAGILLTIGVPSFRYVTNANRIASEVNGLLGDMQYARSESIKEGQTVTVCASTDSATCTGGNAWQSGWIVFLDSNGNQQVDVGEAIIRVQPAFHGTDTFIASAPTFTAITFNRMGYGQTGSAVPITVNLHDVTNTTAWTRCLAVTPIGTATTEKYDPAGIPPCN
ncbi:MAG: GspH/FimT family pseudopilin [Steroidobacteraceae bacterium]